MAVNKVAINGEVKLDLTGDTVTASDLRKGVTAHSKSGVKITGTLASATQATPSIAVSSEGLITASATQSAGIVAAGTKSAKRQLTTQAATTITPGTSNKTAVASGRYTTGVVTVKGDSNLKAENIKKGTSIFGVTGTLESGGTGGESETWVWNAKIDTKTKFSYSIGFESNGESYESLSVGGSAEPSIGGGMSYALRYGSTTIINSSADGAFSPVEATQRYRKITFLTPPTGDLLVYLQANAVKQEADTAVQPTKSLRVISNGTVSITPDAPYDAMKNVDLTVDVSGGGGTKAITIVPYLYGEALTTWDSTAMAYAARIMVAYVEAANGPTVVSLLNVFGFPQEGDAVTAKTLTVTDGCVLFDATRPNAIGTSVVTGGDAMPAESETTTILLVRITGPSARVELDITIL